MPKEMTRRRIDGKPPRPARRRGGGTVTQTPTTPTDIITTFSGGGAPGSSATFGPTELLAGDLFVVAYAVADDAIGGGVEISPSDGLWPFVQAGYGFGGVMTAKVGLDQGGATEFTVTVVTGDTAYYGWVLRGYQTGFADPVIVSTYAVGYTVYLATDIDLDGDICEETAVQDTIVHAELSSPGPGAFTAWAATAWHGLCTSVPASPGLVPPQPIATAGAVGEIGYAFGTGDSPVTIEMEAAPQKHEVTAFIAMLSIAPMNE